MKASKDGHKGLEGASYRELRLLEEMHETPDLSQRNLASRLGVALGVTNLLVRSMVKKGYVRVTRVGWRRWIYALTPAGFAHKAHLTFAYVERFADHYRRVRVLVREQLPTPSMNAESRIAIYGATELAELAYLALRDVGVTEIEIFDEDCHDRMFIGMPIRSLDSLEPGDYSKVMVAHWGSVETRSRELQDRGVPVSEIVTLLQSSRGQNAERPSEVRNASAND